MLCICGVKLCCVDTYATPEYNYRRLKCPKCYTTFYSKETFIGENEGRLKFTEKRKFYRTN